jgi:hypothetical protein
LDLIARCFKQKIEAFLRKVASVAAGLNNALPPRPFALKIAVGNFDAMTGERSLRGLQKEPRNYFVVSGESTVRGVNERSFVLTLDSGCAVNGELFADQKKGLIDFQVWPLRTGSYFREEVAHFIPPTLRQFFGWFVYGPSLNARSEEIKRLDVPDPSAPFTNSHPLKQALRGS